MELGCAARFGTVGAIMFLFVVIGAFLDRELEARGLGNTEE